MTARRRAFLRRPGAVVVLGTLLAATGCGRDDGAQALCAATPIPIHEIQGSGERSARVREKLVVHGVVTAHYEDPAGATAGFFLQSPAGAGDDRRDTSEGLFVMSDAPPELRVLAAVSGTVAELGAAPGVTGLVDATTVVCESSVEAPEPAAIAYPSDLEAVENMLVAIDAELTVTDLYELGRRGVMSVAAGGMVYQPTEISDPGAPAERTRRSNRSRLLLVDDGSSAEYPPRVDYLPAEVSLKTLPRVGDRLSGLVGVVDLRDGERLHAVRRLTPGSRVGQQRFSPPAGEVTVATLNLQNYFNGDGLGGGFPAPRGASSPQEFQRQQAKLVAAVLGMGLPDIVAVQELENDGFGPASAVASLAAAINTRIRSPGDTYRHVALAGDRLGEDAIAVGLLYRGDKVVPVGRPATLLAPPFDQLNRPPLARTFESVRGGERLTVVALHLKSKGCSEAAGPDADRGDGQGCFNATRTRAVETLLRWLAEDPTGAEDPDVLLIGDLNAYTREDPLRVLEAAGYVNLVARFQAGPAYTFVYRGAAGSLDHALASPGLAARAQGARVWHINAPYPRWLDYNLEGKAGPLADALYKASAVRSSDHDPIVVSFR